MSMSELTDDQLDGLFRKSAEEFKMPFDSAAWQDMKARLDANDHIVPTSGVSLVKNILRWGLPLVLLLLLIGWVVYQSDKFAGPVSVLSVQSNPDTVKAVMDWGGGPLASKRPDNGEVANVKSMRMPEQAVTSSRQETGLELIMPDWSTLESRPNTVPVRPTKTRVMPDRIRAVKRSGKEKMDYSESVSTAKKKKVARSPLDKLPYTVAKAPTSTSRVFRRKNLTAGSSLDEKLRKNTADNELTTTPNSMHWSKDRLVSDKQRGTNALVDMPANGSTGSENEFPVAVNESTAIVLSDVAELASRPMKWAKPLPVISRPVEIHPDTTARKIASQPATIRGLSVRFAVSPDLSGIGLTNFTRPGTNVGLFLEYKVASRWSIQAGVIKSTKVYKAATTDYALPDYALKWAVKPEGVDGRCSMIDIPVNIRYDVALRSRLNGQAPSRWFVSGGVTSYIMNQEDYTYQYADPTSPHIYPYNWGWSGTSGSYGFSELNLSAGYERAISRRLSWQVEPFMKVPLKRIGYLKLNLLSTGTFFSLRYKL
ncbi:PorT family protein [Spirosoma spitsbergense]|uniref:PorT family protein n=1 Tax=Spirosoma spitsbergense TaxID=431554 RepID=UPI0012FBBE63|nr:PorT family protein [Spirosoma spitsbergense]